MFEQPFFTVAVLMVVVLFLTLIFPHRAIGGQHFIYVAPGTWQNMKSLLELITPGFDRLKNRPTSRVSGPSRADPPPTHAFRCRFYNLCLFCAAFDDIATMPCAGCRARCDIPAWDLEQDYSGYYELLTALFYPLGAENDKA